MGEQRFNRAHRLIHWAIAFTFLFLLLTIFLRLGWMNKDHVGAIIKNNLSKSGIQISTEEAGALGRQVRIPMWTWHVIAGYTMTGLYLIRLLITARAGIAYKGAFTRGAGFKDRFKAWVYVVFYFFVAVSLFTGWMIVHGPKLLLPGMEWVHVKSIYYLVVFIMLHITGVLIADAGPERGIISKIISGDKQ
jgi:cytochrome b561